MEALLSPDNQRARVFSRQQRLFETPFSSRKCRLFARGCVLFRFSPWRRMNPADIHVMLISMSEGIYSGRAASGSKQRESPGRTAGPTAGVHLRTKVTVAGGKVIILTPHPMTPPHFIVKNMGVSSRNVSEDRMRQFELYVTEIPSASLLITEGQVSRKPHVWYALYSSPEFTRRSS